MRYVVQMLIAAVVGAILGLIIAVRYLDFDVVPTMRGNGHVAQ